MKILIISFYYEPDLCAGSFRTSALVKTLRKKIAKTDSIEIVTSMPNRYKSYRKQTEEIEIDGNVTIKRINIPSHKSGFFDQAGSFLFYFFGALWYVRDKKYDLVFSTSSRLFSGFLGAVISRKKKIPLYLDIRDIFVRTLRSVLKNPVLKAMIPLFALLEKYTVNSAEKVNLISEGFLPYFKKRYKKQFTFYPNGIDEMFLDYDFSQLEQSQLDQKNRAVFTYTGNIGEGQGLEKIVPKIAKKYTNIEFVIVGDGGRRSVLEDFTADIKNIKLVNPVSREKLMEYYKNSDILFIHLNDYEAFTEVLPSKIFEYAATFKPIVAGVDGYARKFLEKNLPGCLVFKPCDFEDFCNKYMNFSKNVDIEGRKAFIAKFSRAKIMDEMTGNILEISKSGSGETQ